MNLPIHISDQAWIEINNIYKNKGIGNELGLRIGVKGSGCSGTSFVLGFDEKAVNDVDFDINGMKIYIEKKHFLYLAGMKLDFIEDNSQRGFTFVSLK